jgi:hypothetical protein
MNCPKCWSERKKKIRLRPVDYAPEQWIKKYCPRHGVVKFTFDKGAKNNDNA